MEKKWKASPKSKTSPCLTKMDIGSRKTHLQGYNLYPLQEYWNSKSKSQRKKKHSQIPGGQKSSDYFFPKKTLDIPGHSWKLSSWTRKHGLKTAGRGEKLPFNFEDQLGDNQLLGFQGVNSMEFPGSPKTWYISGIYCRLGWLYVKCS